MSPCSYSKASCEIQCTQNNSSKKPNHKDVKGEPVTEFSKKMKRRKKTSRNKHSYPVFQMAMPLKYETDYDRYACNK